MLHKQWWKWLWDQIFASTAWLVPIKYLFRIGNHCTAQCGLYRVEKPNLIYGIFEHKNLQEINAYFQKLVSLRRSRVITVWVHQCELLGVIVLLVRYFPNQSSKCLRYMNTKRCHCLRGINFLITSLVLGATNLLHFSEYRPTVWVGRRARAFQVQIENLVYYSCALFLYRIKTKSTSTAWGDSLSLQSRSWGLQSLTS